MATATAKRARAVAAKETAGRTATAAVKDMATAVGARTTATVRATLAATGTPGAVKAGTETVGRSVRGPAMPGVRGRAAEAAIRTQIAGVTGTVAATPADG
jgi:hypothetical protein